MDLRKAIRERRSVRQFLDKPLDIKAVEDLIAQAIDAPSACNLQDWRFIIISDKKALSRLVEMGSAVFIRDAPVGILVLYSNRTLNTEYRDHIQSASAAIQNLLLLAHEKGLGTCWVCHLPPKRQLRKMFRIPDSFDPIAFIPIGYPKRQPAKHKRKLHPDLVSKNRFSHKSARGGAVRLHMKRLGLKVFYAMPYFIRKKVSRIVDKKFAKKFKN